MVASRIFIASSGRGLVLAEQLRELVKDDYAEGVVWREESHGMESSTIIEMLEGATQKYDFAAFVLTGDDVMKATAGDVWKARDNCIFEAGLFMAAIGRKRCFILCSIDPKELPSDLGGILVLSFKEPKDLIDPDQCRRAVTSASAAVKSNVYRMGPVKRSFTPESLLEREKLKHEGGELYEGQVVVASTQPLASGYEAARQVRKNIDGNVRYVYIFPGMPDGADKISQLLQLVLLAGISFDASLAADFGRARDAVRENQERIVQELKQLCVNESLKIYFVPPPHDVQYCIHNATDDRNARLYVRHKDGFIEWESGAEAYHTSSAVRIKHGVADPQPPHAVFYGALGFPLRNTSFEKRLAREVARYFPGVEDKIMQLCLDGRAD